jgi:hypothetical protein
VHGKRGTNRERPVARTFSVSATSHLFALRWDGGRGKLGIVLVLAGDVMYSFCDARSHRSTLPVVMVSMAGLAWRDLYCSYLVWWMWMLVKRGEDEH